MTTESGRICSACEHCGAGALRIVVVADKTITVECLSCDKESAIERRAEPASIAEPPAKSLPS
jgi:hypothetical protein